MKVPASIRRLFEDQRAIANRLRLIVDPRMQGLKHARWHYESRVKELTSFALKVETGRFDKPAALEDFFACTLVVANTTEMQAAEAVVGSNFEVKYRRPVDAAQTHKSPDSFPFDDLRLYAAITGGPTALPAEADLVGVVFEIQIKTFLQHAWSIATHDLLYKTDEANWSKERIAYQIKAMLEHAEVSIQEADRLAESSSLARQNPRNAALKRSIDVVKAQWAADDLPRDVRRLASNMNELLRVLRLEESDLATILSSGKGRRMGFHPANLSPYATLVQYLFEAEEVKILGVLRGSPSKTKVVVHTEVTLPAGVDRSKLPNAILV